MSKQREIGNDPCSCGSGIINKYCCAAIPVGELTKEENERAQQIICARRTEIEERKRLYGEVRPVIHAEHAGHRFIGVGSEAHVSPRWKTFPDFLSHYIFRVLGTEWYMREMAKPLAERHQALQWYEGLATIQQAAALQLIFRPFSKRDSELLLILVATCWRLGQTC